jgi:hypothetical protein
MNFAFTNPSVLLALALGALLLPMLNIYNFKSRGLGIVRYFIGETKTGLVKASWSSALRLAFGLACIVGLVLLAHGDSHGGPLMLAVVGGVPAPAADLSKTLAAYLGRNQGPELFTNVPHTGGTAQSVVVNRNLSINRPLESIQMVWRGRVTISVANMGATAWESPQTIINKITINGTFKGTALTPIKISGATACAWSRLFGARGNSVVINGVRQNDALGQQTLANFGNIGVYDIEVYYYIPTWPLVSFSSRAWESVPYFWQPEDWADSLQVQIDFGDQTSFGTVGGATVALSSFGSAAGSPTLSIATQYVILGDFRPNTSFQTAAVIRNENIITAGMSTIAAGTLLSPMQKQKTTNIMFKSGVALAGTNAAVQVFSTLSDVQIDKTLLTVDNKNIRFNQDNRMNKETVGNKFGTVLPVGYNLFTFLDSQTPRTAFRADDPNVVSQGSTFQLTTDVLTATANQQVNLIQEMIFANKTDPTWLGTR